MFKYLSGDGPVQFIHVQIKVPTVLIDVCPGWRVGDGFPVVIVKSYMIYSAFYLGYNIKKEFNDVGKNRM